MGCCCLAPNGCGGLWVQLVHQCADQVSTGSSWSALPARTKHQCASQKLARLCDAGESTTVQCQFRNAPLCWFSYQLPTQCKADRQYLPTYLIRIGNRQPTGQYLYYLSSSHGLSGLSRARKGLARENRIHLRSGKLEGDGAANHTA